MKITNKELTRLVRKARSMGSFGTYENERNAWGFVCPVHREALDKIGDRSGAHHFPVHHLPWEHKATVALVTEALASHLEDAEINDEPCGDLSKNKS